MTQPSPPTDGVTPISPGQALQDRLTSLHLSQTDAAIHLGIGKATMSDLVNDNRGISVEMALKFERMGWGTADWWLSIQMAWKLHYHRKAS